MTGERVSIKMRASRWEDGGERHISGAERIVSRERAEEVCARLLERALHHARGEADSVHLKIERVRPGEITVVDALPVTTVETGSAAEGRERLCGLMARAGITRPAEVLARMADTWDMRGAMLLHADTLERLEPEPGRGVRATYMDALEDAAGGVCKDHFREALVLASKVAHHPNLVGEVCVSDDPEYVTGYFACRELGYVRITRLKERGCPDGGRIFLFRGSRAEAEGCIRYLEEQKVLVRLRGGAGHG